MNPSSLQKEGESWKAVMKPEMMILLGQMLAWDSPKTKPRPRTTLERWEPSAEEKEHFRELREKRKTKKLNAIKVRGGKKPKKRARF